MIDYYYELPEGTKVFGIERRYVAQYEYHPETSSELQKRIHKEAMDVCKRVWMQNANGVRQVSRYRDINWHRPVDEREFVMIKLQAVEIV